MKLIYCLFIVIIIPTYYAQYGDHEYLEQVNKFQNIYDRFSGTVIGSSGFPIGNASIVLQNSVSNDLLRTFTNNNGAFIFNASIGSYEMVIRASGYVTRRIQISHPMDTGREWKLERFVDVARILIITFSVVGGVCCFPCIVILIGVCCVKLVKKGIEFADDLKYSSDRYIFTQYVPDQRYWEISTYKTGWWDYLCDSPKKLDPVKKIPQDVVLYIFENVINCNLNINRMWKSELEKQSKKQLRDLAIFSLVSKTWNYYASHNYLWKKIYVNYFSDDSLSHNTNSYKVGFLNRHFGSTDYDDKSYRRHMEEIRTSVEKISISSSSSCDNEYISTSSSSSRDNEYISTSSSSSDSNECSPKRTV